jgi:hypothetical protein
MLSEITSVLSLSAAIPVAAIFILVNIPMTVLHSYVKLANDFVKALSFSVP